MATPETENAIETLSYSYVMWWDQKNKYKMITKQNVFSFRMAVRFQKKNNSTQITPFLRHTTPF